MISGISLDSVWRAFGELKSQIKAPFSPEAPRRVPGRDLGSILGGVRSYFCVSLTLFWMFFGLSFSIAFYIGYVWNVYEVGMAYALILHELCQEYLRMLCVRIFKARPWSIALHMLVPIVTLVTYPVILTCATSLKSPLLALPFLRTVMQHPGDTFIIRLPPWGDTLPWRPAPWPLFQLFFHVFFWRHFFIIFTDFGIPRGYQIGAFGRFLMTCSWLGE